MTRDPLREAAQALYQGGKSEDECAELTRARVLRAVRTRSRRRRKLGALFLPLAAVLAVSSAWAGASGRLPEFVRQVKQVGATPPALERAPVLVDRKVVAHATPVVIKKVETPPAPVAEAEQQKKQPEKSVPPADDPALALYRSAHAAHFSAHDPARALAAWDAYLAAAPRGRFSLEARYNRALCLVRLGRSSEALAALEPFAQGAFGGYRQSEASALVDALSR